MNRDRIAYRKQKSAGCIVKAAGEFPDVSGVKYDVTSPTSGRTYVVKVYYLNNDPQLLRVRCTCPFGSGYDKNGEFYSRPVSSCSHGVAALDKYMAARGRKLQVMKIDAARKAHRKVDGDTADGLAFTTRKASAARRKAQS